MCISRVVLNFDEKPVLIGLNSVAVKSQLVLFALSLVVDNKITAREKPLTNLILCNKSFLKTKIIIFRKSYCL